MLAGVQLRKNRLRIFTPWFINNGTLQNTDLSANADVLDKFFCIVSKVGSHREYLVVSFDSTFIFHYQD